jgi:hypothetical protein
MEVARRRHRVKESAGVPNDWSPSSPKRPPTSCVYLYKDSRTLIVPFCRDEAAAALLHLALAGEGDIKWKKDQAGRPSITCESGLVAQASSLEELERLFELETDFELPDPYPNEVRMLKTGAGIKSLAGPSQHRQLAAPDGEERKPRRVKEPKAPRTPKPQGDYYGVAWLAEKLGAEPKDVRTALRAQIKKPDIGWLWSPADAETVAAKLKID